MKRFKFKLEVVLSERKRIEDLRLREWTLAQRIMATMYAELAALENRLSASFDESTQLWAKHNLHGEIGMVAAMETFIKGTKIRIDWKKRDIERASKLAEKTRLEYVHASQKREALEKLKERRLSEYRNIQRKREIKTLDDIYIMSAFLRGRTEDEGEGIA